MNLPFIYGRCKPITGRKPWKEQRVKMIPPEDIKEERGRLSITTIEDAGAAQKQKKKTRKVNCVVHAAAFLRLKRGGRPQLLTPLVILACPIPKSSLISLLANRANIQNGVKSESSCEVKKYVNASLRLDWNLWFIIFVFRCSQSLKMAAWDEHLYFGAKSTVISHFFGECYIVK